MHVRVMQSECQEEETIDVIGCEELDKEESWLAERRLQTMTQSRLGTSSRRTDWPIVIYSTHASAI